MKKSKKGTWTLDDPKYKLFVNCDSAEILPIKMYHFGFNSITFMIQKNEMHTDRFIECTFPINYGDEVSFSNIELAMQYLIRLYNNRKVNQNIIDRIEKYKKYLFNNFPELLI